MSIRNYINIINRLHEGAAMPPPLDLSSVGMQYASQNRTQNGGGMFTYTPKTPVAVNAVAGFLTKQGYAAAPSNGGPVIQYTKGANRVGIMPGEDGRSVEYVLAYPAPPAAAPASPQTQATAPARPALR